jgi:hypothetical protein
VRLTALLMVAVLVTACGGGGGGGGGGPAAPSALTYASPLQATAGTAITPLSPTVTGSVSSYSVNPALPASLALNASTGVISGTPSAATAQATYTVAATNSAGSATFGLVITVAPPGFVWDSTSWDGAHWQ